MGMDNSNPSDKSPAAQAGPADGTTGNVNDSAQQLQASLSRFAQDDEGHQQSLLAALKQVGTQPRTNDNQQPDTNSGKVHDAAEQVDASVSRFAQENQKNREGIVALIKQLSERLRITDAKLLEIHGQIDKLANWIRNYRS